MKFPFLVVTHTKVCVMYTITNEQKQRLCNAFCKTFIESAMNNSFQTTEKDEKRKQDPCSICLGPIQMALKTDCGHLFCGQCLLRWGERSEVDTVKCPMCRQGIYTMNPRLNEEERVSNDPEMIEQRTSVLVRAGTYIYCQWTAQEENSWM